MGKYGCKVAYSAKLLDKHPNRRLNAALIYVIIASFMTSVISTLFMVYCLTESKNHPIFSVKPVMRVTVFPQNSILLSAIGGCCNHHADD
jgi:hypothetical protein